MNYFDLSNFNNSENDFQQNGDSVYNDSSKNEVNEEGKKIVFDEYNLNKDNCQIYIANNKISEVGTKESTLGLKDNNGDKIDSLQNKIGKKRGRLGNSGEHTKYSDDNLRRKCKHIVLKDLILFLNNIIKSIYKNNIGIGINFKQLLTINQRQISDATIQFNKDFLSKTIGDIFSDNISTRYTNYPISHNKNLIFYLTNQRDENKRQYFRKLFSLTFLDCLKHFRGSQYIEELDGLKGFDTIKSTFKDEPEYLNSLNYYIMYFEQIISRKRTRKSRHKENDE